jgi:hypothetical protein
MNNQQSVPLVIILFLTVVVTCAKAQDASYYQQAAGLYDQAAAKCTEPGASCMRRFAAYNRCLALQYSGGGSCGTSPSCSTSCSAPSTSGGAQPTSGGTVGAGNQVGQLADVVGNLLSQWAEARQAKHEQQARDLQLKVEEEAAQMEVDSKAEDEHARQRAAFLADPSGASMPSPGGDQGDDTAKLRAQLNAQDNTDAGALPTQTASLDPSDQIAQVRAQMTEQAQAEDAQAAVSIPPSANPQNVAAPAALSSVFPLNPAFAAAMQSVQDPPPTPAAVATMQGEADVPAPDPSLTDKLHDGLQDLLASARNGVASVKATLGTLMNTPTAQILSAMYSGNMPSPVATDSPEQMEQKVEGQVVIGFGKFISNSPPRALYDYSTANVNQGMTQLGFAVDPVSNNAQQ